jgi:PBP1b-binding outer membrane lipoprotein LpoB
MMKTIVIILLLALLLFSCVTQQQRHEADQAISYIALGVSIVTPPDMVVAWKAKLTFISLVNGVNVSDKDLINALGFIDDLSVKVETIKTYQGMELIHPDIPNLTALRRKIGHK